MNYSKMCYQVHSTNFNRLQTVNATKSILNERLTDLSLKTNLITNGNQLNDFLLDSNITLNSSDILGKIKYPELGLWASNYYALKAFLDSNYDYILIVEDDVRLKPNFYDLMDTYFNDIPSDMDCFMVFTPENIFFDKGYEALQDESQYYTNSDNIWVAHQTWSTGAIIFNKAGAQKMIDYINGGVALPYDLYIFGTDADQYQISSNSRDLNVYSLSKNAERLASLDIYPSTIQGGQLIESI